MVMNEDGWLNVDLWYLAQQHLRTFKSEHTKRAYRHDWIKFLGWLQHKGIKSPTHADLDYKNVCDFRDSELERVEPSTVERNLATLFSFDVEYSNITGRPRRLAAVKLPKVPHKVSLGLNNEESQMLLRVLTLKRKSWPVLSKNFALLIYLYTGARTSEPLAIKMSQVNLANQTFMNVVVKGEKFHTKVFPEELLPAFGTYLEKREETLINYFKRKGGDWLSLTEKERLKYPLLVSTHRAEVGKPETFRCTDRTIRQHAKKVSEGYRINFQPRTLRKTFATKAIETMPTRHVSDLLGHNDVRVTMKYTGTHEETLREGVEGLYSGKSRVA